MASIQTPNRLINVKETYEEVMCKMVFQWMELTEDTSFGELSGEMHEDVFVNIDIKGEQKIRLNRDYIIEVQP